MARNYSETGCENEGELVTGCVRMEITRREDWNLLGKKTGFGRGI